MFLVVYGGLATGGENRLYFTNFSAMTLTRGCNAPLCLVSRGGVHRRVGRCGSTFGGCFPTNSTPRFTDGSFSYGRVCHVVRSRRVGVSIISDNRVCATGTTNFSLSRYFFRNGGGASCSVTCTVSGNIKCFMVSDCRRVRTLGLVTGRGNVVRGTLLHVAPNVSARARRGVSANGISSGFNFTIGANVTSSTMGIILGTRGVRLYKFRYRVNSRVFRSGPFVLTYRVVLSFVGRVASALSFATSVLGLNNNFNIGCARARPDLGLSRGVNRITGTVDSGYTSLKVTIPGVTVRPNEDVITSTNVALCAINSIGRVGNCGGCISVSNNVASGPHFTLCRSPCAMVLTDHMGSGTSFATAVTNEYYRSNSVVRGGIAVPGPQHGRVLTILAANTCGCSVTSGCGHVPHPTIIVLSRSGSCLTMGHRALSSVYDLSVWWPGAGGSPFSQ